MGFIKFGKFLEEFSDSWLR